MKTLDQLETEKRELFVQMDKEDNFKNRMKWVDKLKENEQQQNTLKRARLLDNVNREQARKREFALQAWEAEQITEDITCNDGSLHKVKAKKYPKLASIDYIRIEFKDGRATELKINGERFQMFRVKYEYNKSNEYTRPETFEDFLKLNCIQPKDLTMDEFNEFAEKLNEANEVVKKAIEDYNNKRESIGCFQMQHIGLVTQQNTHFYTYEPKR